MGEMCFSSCAIGKLIYDPADPGQLALLENKKAHSLYLSLGAVIRFWRELCSCALFYKSQLGSQ